MSTSTTEAKPTRSAPPRKARLNLTYVRLDLMRLMRDIPTLFFTAVLPAFFYLIFGAAQDYSNDAVGNANVAMVVMITMAAYGAVTATTNVGGMSALERLQGWGRQLGLTPMTDAGYVAIKVTVAVLVSIIPVTIVFILGAFTGAAAPALSWIESGVLIVAGASTFALYGLCFGLAFRSEAAMAAAGGSLVVLSFLGNVFIPLSGGMLTFARFTPLYGLVSLVRYPATQGWEYSGDNWGAVHQPIWPAIVNVVVWTAIFAVVATLLVRRGRQRI